MRSPKAGLESGGEVIGKLVVREKLPLGLVDQLELFLVQYIL